MQTLRNFLFYSSPLLGAVVGWWIGRSYNAFTEIVDIAFGFGVGCAISILMIVLSVRARFRSDVTLTRTALHKDTPKPSDSQ